MLVTDIFYISHNVFLPKILLFSKDFKEDLVYNTAKWWVIYIIIMFEIVLACFMESLG